MLVGSAAAVEENPLFLLIFLGQNRGRKSLDQLTGSIWKSNRRKARGPLLRNSPPLKDVQPGWPDHRRSEKKKPFVLNSCASIMINDVKSLINDDLVENDKRRRPRRHVVLNLSLR